MNELVSVLVVSYNSEKTILETLESIKSQTYKNIEIVVTDDGSTDRTIDVVKKWAINSDIKIKLVESPKNTGIPANINRGIKSCSGELIKLIGADDLLISKSIQTYLDYFNQNDRSIIFFARVNLFGDVTNAQIDYCDYSYKCLRGENQYHNMLVSNFAMAPSIGLLDKKIIMDVGMFDERFPAFDDYPFYLKLSSLGYKFNLIDEPLVMYRISKKSAGNGMSKRYLKSMSSFFFLVKLKLLLKERMYFTAFKQLIRYGCMFIKYLTK